MTTPPCSPYECSPDRMPTPAGTETTPSGLLLSSPRPRRHRTRGQLSTPGRRGGAGIRPPNLSHSGCGCPLRALGLSDGRALGVGEELAVDGVGDSLFEAEHDLHRGLAFGELLSV
jgi:hypothetical protein